MQFSAPPELTLEDITYEWLENTTDERQLRTAINLIEADGNYFVDLKRTIEKKIGAMHPGGIKAHDRQSDASNTDKKQEIENLMAWKSKMEAEEVHKGKGTETDAFHRQKQAENEKNKGNEAMNSGEFKEALAFYNKAIALDPRNSVIYSNRAMAFLKLKDYRKAAEDASTAAGMDPKNAKAYYRRSLANEALNNNYSAACDLVQVLKLEDAQSIRAKLDQIRNKLNETELKNLAFFESQLSTTDHRTSKPDTAINPTTASSSTSTPAHPAPTTGFVKIQIEEDDEDTPDEADIEYLKQLRKIEAEKNETSEKIRVGDYMGAVRELEALKKRVEDLRHSEDAEFLRLSIMSNIAHCFRQSEMNSESIQRAYEVINCLWTKYEHGKAAEREVDLLLKALVRRGLCYEAVEKSDSAYKDFSRALMVSPNFGTALTHRNKTSVKVSQDTKNEFEDFRRRFYEKRRSLETKKVSVEVEKETEKKPFEPESLAEGEGEVPPTVSMQDIKDQTDSVYQRVHTDASFQPPMVSGQLSPILETVTPPRSEQETQASPKISSFDVENAKTSSTIHFDSKKTVPTPQAPPTLPTQPSRVHTETKLRKSEVHLTAEERSAATQLKQQGNEAFEKKLYATAVNSYLSALDLFGRNLDGLSFKDAGDEKLFSDVSCNLSFAYFSLQNFDRGMEVARRVLGYHPENAKAKYRFVSNAEGALDVLAPEGKVREKNLAEVRDLSAKVNEYLPVLVKSDPKNEKLTKLVTKMEKLGAQVDTKTEVERTKMAAMAPKVVPQVSEEPPTVSAPPHTPPTAIPTSTPAIPTSTPPTPTQPSTKLTSKLQQKVEEQTHLITEKAIESVLKNAQLPTTASQFETELNSIRDNPHHVFEYVAKLKPGFFLEIYGKKQLEFKHFERILNALRHATADNDAEGPLEVAACFLSEFADTYNAKLGLKMCLRKEKAAIQAITVRAKTRFPDLKDRLCWVENNIL